MDVLSDRVGLYDFLEEHDIWEEKPIVGPEEEEAIADLLGFESFKVLQNELLRRRNAYFLHLAQGLSNNRNLVDQREIDEKRGFWYGALWATLVLPKSIQRRAAKAAAKQKESDS